MRPNSGSMPGNHALWLVAVVCFSAVLAASVGGWLERAQADDTTPRPALLLAKATESADRKKGGAGTSSGSHSAAVCETTARKAYEGCMGGSKPDQDGCIRESDDAERRCLMAADLLPDLGTTSVKSSEGIYRIPYADGTKVHISRNFQDHLPPGKIDMAGRGGGTYRIVAAADGVIRYIEDSRDKQQHPKRWLRNTKCFNNFLWIQHDNGEWSKYSHMQMGTSTAKAGLKVNQRVTVGAYLGDEGKVGCAWPAHLHFEVVVPSSDNPGIDEAGGELDGYNYTQARNPRFEDSEGNIFTFKDGENYVAGGGPKCQKDTDCDSGSYCNAGLDLTKNACLPLKADNDTCDLAGGGHQCKSGQCKFGRCYTPQSVSMGNTCYVNDACKAGKCSDVEGVKGVCACQKDSDCDRDEYCDAGLDLKINACRQKLNKGQSCGKAGSVGNDHKCKSGECSGFPKYECK